MTVKPDGVCGHRETLIVMNMLKNFLFVIVGMQESFSVHSELQETQLSETRGQLVTFFHILYKKTEWTFGDQNKCASKKVLNAGLNKSVFNLICKCVM